MICAFPSETVAVMYLEFAISSYEIREKELRFMPVWPDRSSFFLFYRLKNLLKSHCPPKQVQSAAYGDIQPVPAQLL